MCVRVEKRLKLVCVMLTALFNVFVVKVVEEMNERMREYLRDEEETE